MKKTLLLCSFICLIIRLFAQSPEIIKKQKELTDEAYKIYYPEKAAWIGTDLLVAKYLKKIGNPERIGGYVAYTSGNKVHCAFYESSWLHNLLVEFIFTKDFNLNDLEVKEKTRKPSKLETDLIALRQETMKIASRDTFFKQYENTTFNIVPVIENGDKKVYIMTGSQISGVVLFGNDYLLTFDKKNKLKEKKALHKTLHPVEYGVESEEENESSHVHYADEDPFITATDICLLMLFQELTGWKQHTVVSKDYVSIWNGEKKSLLIVPTTNMKHLFSEEKPVPDNESETAKEHQKWLTDNNVPINKLPKANPGHIVYTCDSVLLMRETKGDTIIRWTISGSMSLGFKTFGKATAERWILKDENFGKTSYVTGLDFQGHIEFISLAPKSFLVKNDTLFELETFYYISEDSIDMLYRQFFDAKKEATKKQVMNVIDSNTYHAFKVIYHPNIFKDFIYRGNRKGDEIEITKIWNAGGKKVVNIEIRNQKGDDKTRYNYRFDENYNFMDYDGCQKELLELLTDENRIR